MEERSVGLVWRDWILACCLIAVLGVGGATVVSVELFRLFDGFGFAMASSFVAFVLINAGVTAILQHRVLVKPLPFLHRGPWVAWTAVGSAVTWLAIILSPLRDGLLDDNATPWWTSSEASIALGVGMGVAVGAAQMVPLTEWVKGPWRWVAGNAVAWGVATPLLWYIAEGFRSRSLGAAFPAGAGLLMVAGVVVGLIVGWVVTRLGKRDAVAEQYTRSALDDIGSIDLSE